MGDINGIIKNNPFEIKTLVLAVVFALTAICLNVFLPSVVVIIFPIVAFVAGAAIPFFYLLLKGITEHKKDEKQLRKETELREKSGYKRNGAS
ncbi:MAG: hypothetical protein WCX17_00020 [Parcubacteria group bacterium]|jgi:membrane protein implicated in regulation of membrane protease activity